MRHVPGTMLESLAPQSGHKYSPSSFSAADRPCINTKKQKCPQNIVAHGRTLLTCVDHEQAQSLSPFIAQNTPFFFATPFLAHSKNAYYARTQCVSTNNTSDQQKTLPHPRLPPPSPSPPPNRPPTAGARTDTSTVNETINTAHRTRRAEDRDRDRAASEAAKALGVGSDVYVLRRGKSSDAALEVRNTKIVPYGLV